MTNRIVYLNNKNDLDSNLLSAILQSISPIRLQSQLPLKILLYIIEMLIIAE
jgi:hypothetical protein